MLKSKIRQLKQKDTKKGKQQSDDSLTNSAAPSPMAVLSPPEGAEDKEDGVAPEISQEGQNAKEGKKKRKAPKKKEGIKDEGDKVYLYAIVVPAHGIFAKCKSTYKVLRFLVYLRKFAE